MKKGVLYYLYAQSWRVRFTVLMVWVFACWLAIGLLTYHRSDSSLWFYYDGPTVIDNKAGTWGAQTAALLFFLFGMAAVWMVPFLFLVGYQILYYGSLRQIYDQCIGWMVLLVSSCSLGAWYQIVAVVTGFVPGGALGSAIVKLSSPIDSLLVGLALHALFFIALVVATRGYVLYALVKMGRMVRRLVPIFFHMIRYGWYFLVAIGAKFFRVMRWCVQGLLFPDDRLALTSSELTEETTQLAIPELPTLRPRSVIKPYDQVPHEIVSNKDPGSQDHGYQLPPKSLFVAREFSKDELGNQTKRHEQLAAILEEKLGRFGIQGSVVSIKAGPVVTLFEYQPSIDTKVSKILALEDDLALALQAVAIRIIAPIPGRSVVGFEVANQVRLPVYFSTLALSSEWQSTKALVPLILGVDTSGAKIIVDLAAMPHLLIAGATGSGKSVALNAMIMSLLLKKTPEQLRLILIDPKRIEFALYADIAHLLMPIVDDAQSAGAVLRWAVSEMERRYELLATHGVRNLYDYEKLYVKTPELERLPFIVIIIDELSDLMMTAGKEVEMRIARLAQMARAAGIHLIVATQRPSVDVITGIIKVNFPTRIAFKVSSKVDSRIILDTPGADKLIGKGDMLYLDAASQMVRVHGAYISDDERIAIVNFIREQRSPDYHLLEVAEQPDEELQENDYQLYKDVLAFLKSIDDVSISLVQRKFRIGYNRAARIIEKLEQQGHIMSCEGGKTRKVVR